MNRERASCMHTKLEEQHICLEDSCIKNTEFKLDCLRCLQKTHSHKDSIFHIQEIQLDAQQNQQLIRTQIYENFEFCSNLKHTLQQSVLEMKQKLTSWVDQVSKLISGEIEKYEYSLTEHKGKIEGVQLKKDQLKTIIEFKLMDQGLYKNENQTIQKYLKQNEAVFHSYFNIQFERLSSNFLCKIIPQEELPKISFYKIINKELQYEKCKSVGCSSMEKTQFCLEKSCLQTEGQKLECPICLTKSHLSDNNPKQHTEQFVSAKKLWELQDQYIDDITLFADQKSKQIEDESHQLQELIANYQKCVESKLQTFSNFFRDMEKEILNRLVKLKNQYQKGDFIIHKELFVQQKYSIKGDIEELDNKFKYNLLTISKVFEKEQNIAQEQFQMLWLKGLSILQSDNIQQLSEKFHNPVSAHIQELNNIIFRLTKELSEQNEKQKQSSQPQIPQNIKNDQAPFQQLKQDIQQVSNQILNFTQKQYTDTQQILNAVQQINKQQIPGQNLVATPLRRFQN